MATEIMFLGTAGYKITNSKGKVIMIDPHLEGNKYSPLRVRDLDRVDLVCATHGAPDHLGDTAEIARKFGCPVCCGSDVRESLIRQGVDPAKVRGMCWGLQIVEAGVRIRSVVSMHWSYVFMPDGTYVSGQPMGFIVYPDPGVSIYHWGDTAIFSDLRLIGELYRPKIGLIGCSVPEDEQWARHGIPHPLNGEMTPNEAVLAATWLGVEYAIPSHYSQARDNPDVEKFRRLLEDLHSDDRPPVKPVVLEPGDVFVYPAESD